MTDQIDSNEFELTEEELNRIFFASDSPIVDNAPSDINDDDFKESKRSTPSKKTTISLDSLSEPKKLKRKKKTNKKTVKEEPESEEPIVKKKTGRPLKWTPEKIAAKKEENRLAAELKAKIKKAARESGDHPKSDYEKFHTIHNSVKSREEINELITEQKNQLKKSIGRKFINILDSKNKCRDHLYKIVRYENVTRDPVTACVHCSRIKKFSTVEWKMYINKHRREL
jgi:hypothetical protein